MKTKFIAIAACAENGVIGANNQIPWRIPADFKWFKEKTMGHTLVMGRKTYESMGKPLPGRKTIVLSRQAEMLPGVTTLRGVAELLESELPDTVFIAGGREIYQQCLPLCCELFLTIVKVAYPGDTFFPDYEHLFPHEEILSDTPEFMIVRYFREQLRAQAEQPRVFQRWLRPGWGMQPRQPGPISFPTSVG
jgi:dihydrofolate reductase